MKTRWVIVYVVVFLFIGCKRSSHLEKQSSSLTVSKICSFTYSKEAEESCSGKIGIVYSLLPNLDTLRRGIDLILNSNSLRQHKLEVGVLENDLITGLYVKPKADDIPRILIGQKYYADYWSAMGILAHELGHLLNHHENLCTNSELESDADLFAGRCLALLHATKSQAVSCIDLIPDYVKSSGNYPDKNIRKANILKGFNSLQSNSGLQSFTSINPLVRWRLDKIRNVYSFFIDEEQFDFPVKDSFLSQNGVSLDPTYGVLYIEKTNSTYQLINLQSDSKGMGQLVNDKTAVTYLRKTSRTFKLFNKAILVPFKKIIDTIKTGNDKDYELYYRLDNQNAIATRIVLIDYFYSPNNILRPAFFK